MQRWRYQVSIGDKIALQLDTIYSCMRMVTANPALTSACVAVLYKIKFCVGKFSVFVIVGKLVNLNGKGCYINSIRFLLMRISNIRDSWNSQR